MMTTQIRLKWPMHLAWGTVLLIFPLLSSAALYKWTNENGEVIYSDTRPPVGTEGQRLKAPPPSPVDSNEALQKLKAQTESFRERQEQRENLAQEQKEMAAQAAQKQERCNKLSKQLNLLMNNNRIGLKTPKNDYIPMSEENRQANIQKMQASLAKDC